MVRMINQEWKTQNPDDIGNKKLTARTKFPVLNMVIQKKITQTQTPQQIPSVLTANTSTDLTR